MKAKLFKIHGGPLPKYEYAGVKFRDCGIRGAPRWEVCPSDAKRVGNLRANTINLMCEKIDRELVKKGASNDV